MSLISVIVPVYNVEAYLEECILSIVNQTYRNLEIILVDDGSKDTSGRLCDEWAGKDKRIRVIHKENGGLSDARNAGMEAATGELIGFVDSDDVIHQDMYLHLLAAMNKTGSDISCCGITKETVFGEMHDSDYENVRVFSPEEAVESLIKNEEMSVTVWNKLYKREAVEWLKFRLNKYHEDEFWSHLVFSKANQIAMIDAEYYGYRQRNDSITGRTYSGKNLDYLDARAERLEFIEKNYPALKNTERCNMRFECIRAMQLSMLHMGKEDLAKSREKIHRLVKKYTLKHEHYRKLPVGRQIWCMMSNITFDGTCIVRNTFKYGP